MSMVTDSWDEDAQDWRPDEWDVKAYIVIDYRDRIADSVSGPVPAFGTQEWAAAEPATQAASYARHERDIASAQGRAISDRMAAESGDRAAHREAQQQMSQEWARGRYADQVLSPAAREQREADQAHRDELPKPWEDGYAASFAARIPQQRTAPDETAHVVAQAVNACRVTAARREVHAAAPPATDSEGESWAR